MQCGRFLYHASARLGAMSACGMLTMRRRSSATLLTGRFKGRLRAGCLLSGAVGIIRRGSASSKTPLVRASLDANDCVCTFRHYSICAAYFLDGSPGCCFLEGCFFIRRRYLVVTAGLASDIGLVCRYSCSDMVSRMWRRNGFADAAFSFLLL